MMALSIVYILVICAVIIYLTYGSTMSTLEGDGYMGPWVNIGSCTYGVDDVVCGVGFQKQARSYLPGNTEPIDKDVLYREITCSVNRCPTDGVLSDWTNNGLCSATCGTGTQKQTRMYTPPRYGGKTPEGYTTLTRNIECKINECPVDGSFTEWSNIGTCSASCGTGTQRQTRMYTSPIFGGIDLADKDVVSRDVECKVKDCTIDGSFTEWVNVGNCQTSETDTTIVPCGIGKQLQTRVYNPARYGGVETIGETSRWINCTGISCPTNGVCSAPTYGSCMEMSDVSGCTNKRLNTRVYTPAQNGGVDVDCMLSEYEACDVNVLSTVSGTTKGGMCISKDSLVEIGESACSPDMGNNRFGIRTYTYTGSIGPSKWMTDAQQNGLYSMVFGSAVSYDTIPGFSNVLSEIKYLFGDVKLTRMSAVGIYPIVIKVDVYRAPCTSIPYRNESEANALVISEMGGTCGYRDLTGSFEEGQLLYTQSDTDVKTWIRSQLASLIPNKWTKCFARSAQPVVYYDDLLRYPNVTGDDSIMLDVYYCPKTKGITIFEKGSYKLVFQTDGNMVLYKSNEGAKWSSGTQYKATYLVHSSAPNNDWYLCDNNFNLVWSAGLDHSSPTSKLLLSEFGEFVVIDKHPTMPAFTKITKFLYFTFGDYVDKIYNQFPNYVIYNNNAIFKMLDESYATKICHKDGACDGFNDFWGLPILDKDYGSNPMVDSNWNVVRHQFLQFRCTYNPVSIADMTFDDNTTEGNARAQTIFGGTFYNKIGLIKLHKKADTVFSSIVGNWATNTTIFWLPFFAKKDKDTFMREYRDSVLDLYIRGSVWGLPSDSFRLL